MGRRITQPETAKSTVCAGGDCKARTWVADSRAEAVKHERGGSRACGRSELVPMTVEARRALTAGQPRPDSELLRPLGRLLMLSASAPPGLWVGPAGLLQLGRCCDAGGGSRAGLLLRRQASFAGGRVVGYASPPRLLAGGPSHTRQPEVDESSKVNRADQHYLSAKARLEADAAVAASCVCLLLLRSSLTARPTSRRFELPTATLTTFLSRKSTQHALFSFCASRVVRVALFTQHVGRPV